MLSAINMEVESSKQKLSNLIMDELAKFEATLEAQANSLVTEFRDSRKHQKESTGTAGYSPINIFARRQGQTLQIYWQMVHQTKSQIPGTTKRRAVYIYLPKSGNGYNLDKLTEKAAPFEKDLVREIEIKAQAIRGLWRQAIEIRMATKKLLPKNKQTPQPADENTMRPSTIHTVL